MTDNVVYPNFPHKDSLPQSKEEIRELIEEARLEHIELVYPDVVEDLLLKMHFSGFPLREGQYDKDIALVVDGIRSLMCKMYNIKHPLQEMAEQIQLIDNEDDC